MGWIIGRILLAVPLLVIVWLHCHWSVALVITFLSVSNELSSALLNEVIDVIKARGEAQ